MVNEVVLVGTLASAAKAARVATGASCARAQLRLDTGIETGRLFHTWVPIVAFNAAARKLEGYAPGDVLLIRGRLCWQKLDSDSKGALMVMVRASELFLMTPKSIEVDRDMAEAG